MFILGGEYVPRLVRHGNYAELRIFFFSRYIYFLVCFYGRCGPSPNFCNFVVDSISSKVNHASLRIINRKNNASNHLRPNILPQNDKRLLVEKVLLLQFMPSSVYHILIFENIFTFKFPIESIMPRNNH